MSEKERPKVSWKTIERVADRAEREELERLREMTDEELDAELGEAGFAPDAAAKLVEAALGEGGRGEGGPSRGDGRRYEGAAEGCGAEAPSKAPSPVVSLSASARSGGAR